MVLSFLRLILNGVIKFHKIRTNATEPLQRYNFFHKREKVNFKIF